MAREKAPLTQMERMIGEAIGNEQTIGFELDPARTELPTLWQWLTTIYVGKDFVKQPAVLRIQMGPEGCLVSMTDPDLCQSLEASCPFLQDVFRELEKVLSGSNPPFRRFGKRQPTLRKRKTIT